MTKLGYLSTKCQASQSNSMYKADFWSGFWFWQIYSDHFLEWGSTKLNIRIGGSFWQIFSQNSKHFFPWIKTQSWLLVSCISTYSCHINFSCRSESSNYKLGRIRFLLLVTTGLFLLHVTHQVTQSGFNYIPLGSLFFKFIYLGCLSFTRILRFSSIFVI